MSRESDRSRVQSSKKTAPGPQLRQLRPAALGIASLSLFGAEGGGAFAQSTGATDTTLPEVRVREAPDTGFRTDTTRSGTRTETPLRDIPQFINTVPQALIRSQNATTLTDALRNVPGISYGAAEGGTQANQVFFLRGFPLNPGHLHRWRARPRRIQSRSLRDRCGRSAEGLLRAHVRPRLDSRSHQPGHEDRRPTRAARSCALGRFVRAEAR